MDQESIRPTLVKVATALAFGAGVCVGLLLIPLLFVPFELRYINANDGEFVIPPWLYMPLSGLITAGFGGHAMGGKSKYLKSFGVGAFAVGLTFFLATIAVALYKALSGSL